MSAVVCLGAHHNKTRQNATSTQSFVSRSLPCCSRWMAAAMCSASFCLSNSRSSFNRDTARLSSSSARLNTQWLETGETCVSDNVVCLLGKVRERSREREREESRWKKKQKKGWRRGKRRKRFVHIYTNAHAQTFQNLLTTTTQTQHRACGWTRESFHGPACKCTHTRRHTQTHTRKTQQLALSHKTICSLSRCLPPFPPTLRIPIPPHSLLKNHTWALRASVRGASARNRRRSSSSSCRQRCTTPQDEERGAPLCVRVCVREDIRQSPV